MKLQFKHQKFQADAAKAVVDVFAGQPYLTPTYMMDRGTGIFQIGMNEEDDFTGWRNQPLVPELSKRMILEQIQEIQRIYQITPSQKLEGEGYNLTIEMETGVGKTYTYIKTMFELNKHYGWSKFIVVVPSIAIREGVYKSFEVTQEHFAEEYGKKIRFFIYNSAQLTEIDRFASDNSINVMIINSQAFNARGKDARRIYMKLDEFRSRRPIDIIAKTNPVLIIDEPQSVEGKQTKERLREFHPLLTLRYSATHKSDSIYNMIYRLDAMEAYNKRLVKKIAVKGIAESGSTATESYVYLQSINLSKADPTATIQFDYKGTSGIRKVTKTVSIGFNLYDQSNGMEEYHNNFVVKSIDGRDDSVEFLNGIKIYAGDVIGKVSEEQLRRIQIRETILSHIERERQLYYKGIKVEKYGVSIVNVGSTAFLRYSGILIRKNGEKIGIPVSVITDCDVRPYDIDEKTKEKQFNEKVSESLQAEQAKNEKYSNGSVRGFTSPRWTLEYCIAMSCLSEDFHKAVHYGKKILNAQENIAITDSKIDEANGLVKEEAKQWDSLPLSKRAYNIFSLMLNADGKSGLKAIVAQCLASILRWKVSVIPEKLTQEKMFDVELYGLKTDEKKKVELSNKIENDSFLGYIVRAIKYASGIEE